MTNDHPRWIVLKFGGTSVSSAANWATIAGVVRDRIEDGYRPLVVHSALSGVTERLETLVSRGIARERAAVIAEIDELHDALASELGLDTYQIGVLLNEDRSELRELVEGVALVGKITPRTRARLLAFGERMATHIATAYLRREGIPVTWIDARDVLTSVDTRNGSELLSYLSAECDAAADDALAARLNEAEGVPVTQGFTASNADGETVVLGRGGSDSAAAYIAGKLSAEHLEIWTDVPGMFTADPRVVPSARLLRQLDYREAPGGRNHRK